MTRSSVFKEIEMLYNNIILLNMNAYVCFTKNIKKQKTSFADDLQGLKVGKGVYTFVKIGRCFFLNCSEKLFATNKVTEKTKKSSIRKFWIRDINSPFVRSNSGTPPNSRFPRFMTLPPSIVWHPRIINA